MKKKLAYLLSIFIIFGIVVAGYFTYVKYSVQQGKLKILASPEASIIINDKSFGKTPYEGTFEPGEYIIKLIPDAQGASESATWEGKVVINQNTLTFVNRELGSNDLSSSGVIFSVKKMDSKPTKENTGEIEVKTEPDGSIVYLDNEEQGISPLIISEVSEGEHELAIDTPGFFRRSQKVKVDTGYRVIAEYKLATDPTYKKVDKDIISDNESTDEAELNDEENSDESDARNDSKITPSISPTKSPKTTGTSTKNDSFLVTVDDTGTGWLRVRASASTSGTELGKVDTGEELEVLEEKNGWYRIEFNGEVGWVSSTYVTKVE